jgi:hypothetical protein
MPKSKMSISHDTAAASQWTSPTNKRASRRIAASLLSTADVTALKMNTERKALPTDWLGLGDRPGEAIQNSESLGHVRGQHDRHYSQKRTPQHLRAGSQSGGVTMPAASTNFSQITDSGVTTK